MNFYFIYYLFNTNTGKGYIGYTNDLNRRLYDHLKQLDEGIHPNTDLQEDYAKGCLTIEVLEAYYDKDNKYICNREKHLIAEYDTFKNGYNQTVGGEGQIDERIFSQDNILNAYAILQFYPSASSKIVQDIFNMSESSVLRLKNRKVHISTIAIFDKLSPERKEQLRNELNKEYNLEERIAEHHQNVTYRNRGLKKEQILMILAVGTNRKKKGAHMERVLGLAPSHCSRIIRGDRYKEFYAEYMNMSETDKKTWLDKGLNFFQLD